MNFPKIYIFATIMKLLSIIKTFDKKQWVGFLTYIQLYYSTKSIIWKTAKWMDSISIWQDNSKLDYTAEMFLKELPFSIKSKSLSKVLANLGTIAEEYIGWMVWKDNPDLKASCQMTGLAQKSLSDEYLATQKSILHKSDDNTISIWDDYYRMQALFHDYYYQISYSEDDHTQVFKDLLDCFKTSTATIAQFLNVEIKNREKLLSESWIQHKTFFDVLYKTNTKLVHITNPLIQMNYHKEPKAYDYLRDILYSDKINNLSKYVQYCIATYCMVFLTGVIKQGAIYRGQELLDLYEFSLEKGIFTLNENMPLNRFINIIGVGSKFEKYYWARNIVDNWAYKVDKHNHKSIAVLGHATIDFHQKKYENVVISLSQMKSSNFSHRLRSRWLLLKAQFEINLKYVEVLKVQIDNFRRFLVSNETRIKHSTFEGTKVAIKILKMVLDRKDSSQIMEYYESSKYVFERRWIIDKIKNPMR